jgi:hypothetical protein
MHRRVALAWLTGLAGFLLATNLYVNPVDDRALYLSGFDDSFSYMAIADAAPTLPDTAIRFHHAQRLAVPYAIGLAHDLTGVGLHTLFFVTALALAVCIIVCLQRALAALEVPLPASVLALGIFALNPWTFRPYVAFPELVDDLGFVAGLAVMLLALVRRRPWLLVAGQAVASSSRQTGLMLLPMVLLWIWLDEGWRQLPRGRRVTAALSTVALAILIYIVTGMLAAEFGTANTIGDHLIGIADWARTSFSAKAFVKFLIAAAEPPLMLLTLIGAFLLVLKRRPTMVLLLLFGSASVWAQPLLAGPEITGGNIQRLITIGLAPLVLATGIAMRDAGGFAAFRGLLSFCLVAVCLGSLHHHYVSPAIPYSDTNRMSILFFGFAVLVIGGAAVVEARRVNAETDR